MMWIIRGTNAQTGDDFALVVEARSKPAAEAWALKRGVPAAFIGTAEAADIAEAKRTRQLWKYTSDSRYTCFGQPLMTKQLVCLMLVGVLTAGFVYARTSKRHSHRTNSTTVSRTMPHRGAVLPAAKPICGESEALGAVALGWPQGSNIS